ncbi:VanZ family protein [Bifidobacterium avesanii]|uniref:Teicoplanin resistance protein VanZ n=1 Tax=Bifidobacterium avesanii TaxID=1798157 RepID=A0A7K3TGY1_9BIFI|nr:VanZ family protein [Bifidobacterium avesanii]KAB8287727.1 teicoplanin resistance protein VanZ [Bifidobacterium avesanii]NEG78186.1 teicoplanin resistance protein VanZ [Bifidobacterium avesanii]
MAFLRSFSMSFAFAVAMWPFASAVLTLPVLALLYRRDNRLRFTSALGAYLVVLYLLSLGCFTLYPMPDDAIAYCATHHLSPQLDPLGFIGDLRSDGITAVLQIGLNVVFFLPLGFFMGRTFRWPFRVALPVGFFTSLLIETSQLTGVFGLFPCAYRLFDVDDLIWNTSGAMIGWLAAWLLNRRFPVEVLDESAVTREPGFVRRCVALAIDMVLVIAVSAPVALLVRVGAAYASASFGADVYFVVQSAVFALFEGLLPWLRDGQTLGGRFVRMTVETRPRTGWRRFAFYAARFAVLYAILFGSHWQSPWPALVFLACAVCWLVRHRMPYDFI